MHATVSDRQSGLSDTVTDEGEPVAQRAKELDIFCISALELDVNERARLAASHLDVHDASGPVDTSQQRSYVLHRNFGVVDTHKLIANENTL